LNISGAPTSSRSPEDDSESDQPKKSDQFGGVPGSCVALIFCVSTQLPPSR
jgi:hypothetical protein